MNKKLTDITVVLDRSGSMSSCQKEAQNGLNHFVDSQKKEKGSANFTLVQFDTEYEFVHKGIPISKVPSCKLQPRGMTALLDAVGKAINETDERLGKTSGKEEPGLVVFVIITDGQENSSHEYNKEQVKELIDKRQKESNWQFTFLGANQDAFAEAGGIGIGKVSTLNYDVSKSAVAFSSVARNVSSMRTANAGGQAVMNSYTDEEREVSKE